MVLRAKRRLLFSGKPLTAAQEANTKLNLEEADGGKTVLSSLPRRLVFELTNACNLNCVMCGRNAAEFKPTVFDMDWFRFFEPMMDTVEEVTLMGWGEPTIHPHFEEMLNLLDRHAVRKYFCTNGMRLDQLTDAIFDNHVDVFAVSLDGASAATNDRIRRGSNFEKITDSLRKIEEIKRARGLSYPWINFVFCAMRSNLHEIPDMVRLAKRIGIDEVKVVYLTAFDDAMSDEVLWGHQDEVRTVFNQSISLAGELGIAIKLPYIQGEDSAGQRAHQDCYVPWRDFFLGSDGYIRPCMSTPVQFGRFDVNQTFESMWNSQPYQLYRQVVNDERKMDDACRHCYQSSHCNWNNRVTWYQQEQVFAPDWNS